MPTTSGRVDGTDYDDTIDLRNPVNTHGDSGSGNNTYVFGRGAGQDTISEYHSNVDIRITGGLLPSDVVLSRGVNAAGEENYNLIITINNGNGTPADTLTIGHYFYSISYKIEQVIFDDGTVWDQFYLDNLGVNNAPTFTGNFTNQQAAEDSVFTFAIPLSDTFTDGGEIGDTLTYTATLEGGGLLPGWLAFNPATGILGGTPQNEDVGGNLQIVITATDASDLKVSSNVFTLTVNDNTNAPTFTGTIINQIVTKGSAFTFAIPSGAFADIDDADTHTYSATQKDGSLLPNWLEIDSATGALRNKPGSQVPEIDDLKIIITLTDSTDRSVSSNVFNLTVKGGEIDLTADAGNTIVTGSTDNDTYLFGRGAGKDVINDGGGANTIKIAGGITPENIIVKRSDGYGYFYKGRLRKGGGTDLILSIKGNDTDELTIKNYFAKFAHGIHQVLFDGGIKWYRFDLDLKTAIVPTREDGRTGGTYYNDTYDLRNPITTSVFEVGGWHGHDTYVFGRGAGKHEIFERSGGIYNGGFDTVRIVDLLPSDIIVRRSGRDLIIYIKNSTNDRLIVKEHFNDREIEYVRFDNGTGWGKSHIDNLTSNNTSTFTGNFTDQTVDEDSEFRFTIPSGTFTDIDDVDRLIYTAAREGGGLLPDWLEIDRTTGALSGTPKNEDVGDDLRIIITATDRTGFRGSSNTFKLNVTNINDAPIFTGNLADRTVTAGTSTFNLPIPSGGTFADIDVGDTLTYTATLEDGSVLPDWLEIDRTTGALRNKPGSQVPAIDKLEIIITATDGNDSISSNAFTLDVTNAPTFTGSLADQTVTEDTAFTFAIPPGSFADIDVGDTLTYTAKLEDGSALPDWLVIDSTTGALRNKPGSQVPAIDKLQIIITAIDRTGSSISSNAFTLDVANAPTFTGSLADQTATEDSDFTFAIPDGTFADIDVGDTLTYTAKLEGDKPLPKWLKIDRTTGTLSGKPENGDVTDDDLRIIITATDGNDSVSSNVFTLNVANTNDAPTFTGSFTAQTASEDTAFTFAIPDGTFADIDVGDTLTYTAKLEGDKVLPEWLKIDPTTGILSGTPKNGDVTDDDLKIIITATDSDSLNISSNVFTLTVTNTNDAPTFTGSLADQTVTEDTAFTFAIPPGSFADIDVGDTLTYTAKLEDGSALPDWLVIDSTTGALRNKPGSQVPAIDKLQIIITAIDRTGSSISSNAFTLDVANAPTFTGSLADQTATEDSDFTFAIPDGTFADIDVGDTLTYTAKLEGDKPLPKWLKIDRTTGTLSGKPENGDVTDDDLRIIITATDGNDSVSSNVFTLNVANTNDAPTFTGSFTAQTASEDTAFTFAIPDGTFADIDVGDTLTYTAKLEGDKVLPEWLKIDPTTGILSGTPKNGDVTDDDLKIIITATDSDSLNISSNVFTLTVTNTNDAPTFTGSLADQTVTEDTAFTFAIPPGSFADIDVGDTLTYTAKLEDGSALPDWLVIDRTTGALRNKPGSQVPAIDKLQIIITAIDRTGSSISSNAFTLDVANAPTFTGSLADQTATEDSDFTFAIPDGTFADIDVGDTLTYTAKLEGDKPLPKWLKIDRTTGTLSGKPENGDVTDDDLRIIITATDGNDSVSSNVFTLNVANTNDAPTFTGSFTAQTASEDTAFTFAIPDGTFADIDVGDTLTYTAKLEGDKVLPEWLKIDPTTGILSGTPKNGDVTDDDLKIIITATDSDSLNISSNVFTLTVTNTNDAPTFTGSLADQTVTEDTAFTFAIPPGSFADIDVGDTLTYTAKLEDGSALPDWLVIDSTTGTFTNKLGSTKEIGKLQIKVTATDADGLSVSSNVFALDVVAREPTDLRGNDNSNVRGGIGDDTYLFTRGAGQDTIYDWDYNAGNTDTVKITGDVSPTEVTLSRGVNAAGKETNDLIITIRGVNGTSADTLTIREYFRFAFYKIEQVVFDNGTVWGRDKLDAVALPLAGSDGIVDETFDLRSAASDIVSADTGNDTYLFSRGAGQDVIDDAGGNMDTIRITGSVLPSDVVLSRAVNSSGGATNDLVIAIGNDTLTVKDYFNGSANKIENIVFDSDSTEWGTDELNAAALRQEAGMSRMVGTMGDDIFDLTNPASSLIYGSRGNDTYRFGIGSGQDTIYDWDSTAGNRDTLEFLSGVDANQLWLRQDGDNLEVSIIGTDDKVTIRNWYSGSEQHIEEFTTSDGQTLMHGQVDNLVQAMAAFAPPASGETTLPDDYQRTLDPVIAANWK